MGNSKGNSATAFHAQIICQLSVEDCAALADRGITEGLMQNILKEIEVREFCFLYAFFQILKFVFISSITEHLVCDRHCTKS